LQVGLQIVCNGEEARKLLSIANRKDPGAVAAGQCRGVIA
jgi:hypothetical protein